MKLIISFNEETIELNAVRAIPDGENPIEAFHSHLVDRTALLLSISREAAKEVVDWGDEDAEDGEVSWNVVGGDAYATINFGGSYNEYISMVDAPMK